ncbi:MAG: HEPN domain-containing protein [Thermoanaerobaculia bacterium]
MSLNESNRWRLSSFIEQSFRNQADRDYISARLLFKAELYQNFLWPSLQAVEKYLKAIFLFNYVPVKRFDHKVAPMLDEVKGLPSLESVIPEHVDKFVRHLGTYGPDRYLSHQFSLTNTDLQDLDWSVWHIRRYCQDFLLMPDDEKLKPEKLDRVPFERQHRQALNADPGKPALFRISGLLERVLAEGPAPMQEALMWNNSCLSSSETDIPPHAILMIENPVHIISPELITILEGLVKLPKEAC